MNPYKIKKVKKDCNGYNKELLCDLTNVSCKYQDNDMQKERTINNCSSKSIEIQEKPKAKVRKLAR